MRISLLDPWLLDVGGHFLDWDLRVTKELLSAGHKVDLYSHVTISPKAQQLVSALAPLTPIFRANCFVHPAQVDAIAGEVTLFLDGGSMSVEDLGRVAKSDIWLWPSMSASHLYACALMNPGIAISGCIHQEPEHMYANGRMWWRYAFIKAEQAGLRLNVGTTTQQLLSEYSSLSGRARISQFPVAHDGAVPDIARTALRRIGFLGAQRPEKGVEILPVLVPQLLQAGYEVLIQDSAGVVRGDNAAGLTIVGYVPDLSEEIRKCDLVVVPYHPACYRARGSGIVWDAIASGVPVIAPSGTASGALIESSGAGKTFRSLSLDNVYGAIQQAAREYVQIGNAAFVASQRWRQTQGTRRFVTAMLGDVSPMPAA